MAISLVAGTATPSSSSGGGPAFGLARYTSNGALDTTFGNGGTVTTSFGRGNEELTVLLLQPNGQIVVAGNEPGSSKKRPNKPLSCATTPMGLSIPASAPMESLKP
jgi:hypothetical protein